MINYNNHNITGISYNNHSIKYVYGCGGNLVWSGDTPTPPSGYTDQPLTMVFEDSGTFKLISGGSIDYSIDSGSSWTTLAAYTNSPMFNNGQKVMLRKSSVNEVKNLSVSTFFHAEGNPLSLIYGEDFNGQTEFRETLDDLSFLFKGCIGLTNIDNLVLPSTTLTPGCYQKMFSGCTSLATVPTDLLPAATLSTACYASMFDGCTNLTNVPTLSASVLTQNCYQKMFNGCTSLSTVPTDLLSATALVKLCYAGMFDGCTRLQNAPDLPALMLTERCYDGMFYNCSNLNYIKCLARNIDAENCTRFWTSLVSSTGTFVKNPLMSSWTTGANGIPNGWTVVDA